MIQHNHTRVQYLYNELASLSLHRLLNSLQNPDHSNGSNVLPIATTFRQPDNPGTMQKVFSVYMGVHCLLPGNLYYLLRTGTGFFEFHNPLFPVGSPYSLRKNPMDRSLWLGNLLYVLPYGHVQGPVPSVLPV